MYKAIETDDVELVQSLIKTGIDVNRIDDEQVLPPLLWLVDHMSKVWAIGDEEMRKQSSQRQTRILEMLIGAGADVNATTSHGYNALHLIFKALLDYDINFVEVLLKHGCDVNATCHSNAMMGRAESTTILHLAVEGINYYKSNDDIAEVIKLLLEHGADANVKNSDGWNAVEYYLLSYTNSYYPELLGHRGIDLNAVKIFSLDDIGMSPLHRSSIFDEYDDFYELVTGPGVDLNVVDKLGNTPLLYAVATVRNDLLPEEADCKLKVKKIKLLVGLGADINRTYQSYNNDRTNKILDLSPTNREKMVYDTLLQGAALGSSSRNKLISSFETYSYEMRTCEAEDGNNKDSDEGTCGKVLIVLSWLLVIMTMPFSLFVCFKVVQEYERAVIFRLGRLLSGGAKGPGIFFILPCVDSYARVDLRTRTYDVPPQEVLTKDSVTVSVDAVVYYRVNNATISIANVENAHHSTRLLAQTTLRNTMGTRPLHEILSERETISGNMQISLDEATDSWGIKVERVEIKDVRLPVQLQRAMAAEAEAAREARAKVIAAEGEQKASRALREASEVIGDSPAALQLRYLQTLNTISAEKNSTIVFPLPIDMLTYFLKAKEAA